MFDGEKKKIPSSRRCFNGGPKMETGGDIFFFKDGWLYLVTEIKLPRLLLLRYSK